MHDQMDDDDVLSTQAWLQAHPPAAFGPVDAPVPQPAELLWQWSSSGGGAVVGSCAPHTLALPPLPCDLNVGLEAAYRAKDGDAKPGVEIVIAAALAAGAALSACDVLTFRNNLNKILGTTLDPKAGWTVDACLVCGTLFLDIVKPAEQAWICTPEQQRFVSWGYMFEARATGQAVADANAETNVLVSTCVGAHRVLLGAEIDCCDCGEQTSAARSPPALLSSLRELKTFRQPQHRGQWRTLYRLKHPKWWLQSHLAGVPALVLGARDDGGIVHAIHTVPTHDLPRLSLQNGEAWSPHAALAFGAAALTWFRSTASRHAGRHVRFTYDPASGAIRASVVADGSLPARLAAALTPA
jgi:RAT1-interacting protein